MSTVSLMTSLLTEDCSRFLPPQHRTLDHRLFEDESVAQQYPLMTQNANVVDLEDRRHGAGCQSDTSGQDPSDTEMPVLPAIRCGARSQCSRWLSIKSTRGLMWCRPVWNDVLSILESMCRSSFDEQRSLSLSWQLFVNICSRLRHRQRHLHQQLQYAGQSNRASPVSFCSVCLYIIIIFYIFFIFCPR